MCYIERKKNLKNLDCDCGIPTYGPPCITVYLVRIWTNKNADEKAHTFLRRSKNVKKMDESGRKADTV